MSNDVKGTNFHPIWVTHSFNRQEGLRKITNNLNYGSRPPGVSQRNFRISSISVQGRKWWRLYPAHRRCASTKVHGVQLEKSSLKNTVLITSIRQRHARNLVLKQISVHNNKNRSVSFNSIVHGGNRHSISYCCLGRQFPPKMSTPLPTAQPLLLDLHRTFEL
jgi:hypothetical protein